MKNILLIFTALILFVGCGDTKETATKSKNNQEVVAKKEITPLEKIEGKWYYTDAFGISRIYAINEKHQFTDDLDSKPFKENVVVSDTGNSLKFDNTVYTFDIEYPKIINSCFDFKLIKKDDKIIQNPNSFKLCKLDNSVENYCGNYYKKDTIEFFIKWVTPYGKKPENMSFDCDKVHPYIKKIEVYKVFESNRLKEILAPSDNISQKLKEIEEEEKSLMFEFNKKKDEYDKKLHGNARDYYQSLRTKTISSEQQKRLNQLSKEKNKIINLRTAEIEEIAKSMAKEDYENLKIFNDYNNKYDINYRGSNRYYYVSELMDYYKYR